MENITFTKSEKGNKKACYGGYLYNYDSNSKVDTSLTF